MASTIVGACGEFYVASYLSGLGLITALPRSGVPGCDLLVTSKEGGYAIRIVVKTSNQPIKKDKKLGKIHLWSTSASALKLNDQHLWYAYVWLNDWPEKENNTPEIFFVPSGFVVERLAGDLTTKWPFFWLNVDETAQFRGNRGIKPILTVLKWNVAE